MDQRDARCPRRSRRGHRACRQSARGQPAGVARPGRAAGSGTGLRPVWETCRLGAACPRAATSQALHDLPAAHRSKESLLTSRGRSIWRRRCRRRSRRRAPPVGRRGRGEDAGEVGELVGEVDAVAAGEHGGAVLGDLHAGAVAVQLVLIRPLRALTEPAAVGLGQHRLDPRAPGKSHAQPWPPPAGRHHRLISTVTRLT